MRVIGAIGLVLVGLLTAVAAKAAVPTEEKSIAVLRALDKMTARVEELSVPINQPTSFGNLDVVVRTCRTTVPEEVPETAAFIDISENKPGLPAGAVFHGWMFASSPALSAMEHPVYDIWLVGCKGEIEKQEPKK